MSFALFEHARWSVENASFDQGEIILNQAITHFSLLELTPKIAKSLNFPLIFIKPTARRKSQIIIGRPINKLSLNNNFLDNNSLNKNL